VQKTHTRIGCQYYSNIEWKGYNDDTIKEMDSNALSFWESYKKIIFSAMESLQDDENEKHTK